MSDFPLVDVAWPKSWRFHRQRIVIKVRMDAILPKLLEAGMDDFAR